MDHGIEVYEDTDAGEWVVMHYGSFVEAFATEALANEFATHLAGELDAHHEEA